MRRLLALGLLLPFVSIGCVAGVDGPCSDNPCDDGDFCTTDDCTVDDTTSSGFTCTNEAVDCEDEFCNPEDGECVECLNNDECDNGNFCDGTEVCAQNTCIDGPDPCDTANETCDEENDECIGAVDPCVDIVCSNGETCVDGECIADDPCADVTCDEGESCVDGECVPDMTGGDATAGEAYYAANCAGCHGADASGGVGPNIQGYTAAELQAGVEAAAVHNSITIAADDYANLEAFLATF